jgi:hypothetical protein
MNQPTFAQARVMLYLALINGAKGIFWYSYSDPGWKLPDTPLWNRFEDLNKETAALAGPIMLGAEPAGLKVVSGTPDTPVGVLQCLAREHSGKLYVLLANPSDKPLQVTLTPPEGYTAASLLSGNAAELKDGQVMLELQGTGAETVAFSKTPATSATEKPKLQQENAPTTEKSGTTEPKS